jgi:hypothetical protein
MIFINASIWNSRRDDGANALPLPERNDHYIEVAAACKRRGTEFPGISQIKHTLGVGSRGS